MKKTRLLALVLIVAMALTGAGYAFWSETLTVNTTVKTGQLDFQFKDADIIEPIKDISKGPIGYINNGDNQDNSELNIELQKMYPGAYATLLFKVVNNSTMHGKLNGFEVTSGAAKYDKYVRITKIEVNGTKKFEGYEENSISITELDTKLNDVFKNNDDLVMGIQGETEFKITLWIAKCADETKVEENLGRGWQGDGAAIVYTLKARGEQWNDDGSCPPEDPGEEETPKTPITGVAIVKQGKVYTATVTPSGATETANYKWEIEQSGNWTTLQEGINMTTYTHTSAGAIHLRVTVTGMGDYNEGDVGYFPPGQN